MGDERPQLAASVTQARPQRDDRPTERDVVMAKILAAHRARAPIRFYGHSPAKWTTAISELLRRGRLDAAAYAVRRMREFKPNFGWAVELCNLFDAMPPLDGRRLPFADDLTKEVQVVRRESADCVAIVFCDIRHHFGLPLPYVHRWLGALPASIVYLRDYRQVFFLAGVPSLGDTREATIAALRERVQALGGRRIFCFGDSVGTLPALHYGIDLNAEAVLALGGPVSLDPSLISNPSLAGHVREVLKTFPDFAHLDMQKCYADAPNPPRVHIAYGSDNRDDRFHAERMRGLPNVVLETLADYSGHDVVAQLVLRGRFQALLEQFLDAGCNERDAAESRPIYARS